MKIKDLFPGENSSQDISTLVFDTRKLVVDCVFIAIRGVRHDGHDFLSDAIKSGARVLVVEDATKVPAGFTGLVKVVASSRAELSRLAAAWVGRPSEKLITIGVTGTNGKTTTTNMIESVLAEAGIATGVIGTIDHHLGPHVWPTEMTTPDPVAFQTRLSDFVKLGAKSVALEVSSHALDQARVDAVAFDIGVFTNLTRDHLDYHGTMEKYFEAKLRFFTELLKQSTKKQTYAIINADDVWGAQIVERLMASKDGIDKKPSVWTYGEKNRARQSSSAPDFEFHIKSQGFDGVHFSLRTPAGDFALKLSMAGVHNVQNAICAMATAMAAGVSAQQAALGVEKIRGVSGRLEQVPNGKGLHVFVDYAHTDDALNAILKLLQGIRAEARLRNSDGQNAKIITVFGCGGDRDRGKRPLMMKAALAGSDSVIVTSDNPRTEDPNVIIDDAMAVVAPGDLSKVVRDADRRSAIGRAIRMAQAGDVILIAGKGHEATQQIGTVKTAFSDVNVAREFLEESNGPTSN